MDISHPVCNEPDQTDEGSSQAWLFFGSFHLVLYQKDIQVSGNGFCMKKSANPNYCMAALDDKITAYTTRLQHHTQQIQRTDFILQV